MIRPDQIEEILDQYLLDYIDGKCTNVNVMFIGHTGYGKTSVIERWIKKHEAEIATLNDVYPGTLYDVENGILVKHFDNGKSQYVYSDDELKDLQKDNSVLFLPRINQIKNQEGIDVLYAIIKNRQVPNYQGVEYDLHNLCMVIATAYPEDGSYYTFPIPDEMKYLFNVYEVQPILQDTAEYLYNYYKSFDRNDDKFRMDILDRICKWPDLINHTPAFSPRILKQELEWADDECSFLEKLEKRVNSFKDEDPETISRFREIFENQ